MSVRKGTQGENEPEACAWEGVTRREDKAQDTAEAGRLGKEHCSMQ